MKKNGFMEGAIIATFAIVLSKVLGLIYVIPFYNIIGEQGGALYGYAYNIYNFFLIISSAGIPLAISKLTSEYVTKKEDEKKEHMFVISKLAIRMFSIFSFAVCFFFAKYIATTIIGNVSGGNSVEDIAFVIRCISFALLVVPLLSISRGYLQGHKYIAASSISQVIEQFVRIAIILLGSFVSYKILKFPLTIAVGISVFSACGGAIAGYLYLLLKMRHVKFSKKVSIRDINNDEKKDIIKKVIGYSLPFIIVNIANSIYNTTDMILVIRGLSSLGYNALDVETISSIFTTWGDKLSNIVRAIATGLTISLIPSLVSSYVSKDMKSVNSYFNKVLQVLLFIIFPLTIFMSVFSKEIWNVFYGSSIYGPLVFKFLILVVVFDSGYILIGSALQGLYKTKLIYISVAIGLLTNLILDLPLMYLFNSLGWYPFYGAITSTIIGYLLALGIPIIYLKMKDSFEYKETTCKIPKLIVSYAIVTMLCILYKHYIHFANGRIITIVYLSIIGIIVFLIYALINKNELLNILELKFSRFIKKEKKWRYL